MRNGWSAALARPAVLDGAAGVAAISLDVLLTSAGWHSGWPLLVSIAVGAPVALLRRWPTPVTGYLAVLLVGCQLWGSFSGNSVQILLTIALVVLARRAGWRRIVPLALLAGAANVLKLADPENLVKAWSWLIPVVFTAGPVVVGRYLRAQAGHAPLTREPADLLLAAAGATLAVLGTWPLWTTGALWSSGPVLAPAAGLLVVGSGLALGLARRKPGTVLLAQSAAALALDRYPTWTAGTFPVLVCVALGVFTMRVGWAWVGAGACLGYGVLVVSLVDGTAGLPVLAALVVSALLVALAVTVGRYLLARQETAAQAVAAAQARARALERERIAREVHDSVAHHVGAVALMAGAAALRLRADPHAPLDDALAEIRATANRALEDLRGLLAVPRDPGAAPVPDLWAALDDAVTRMSTAGLDVSLEVDARAKQAPLVARAAAARIVQEGLTNVLKHAGPGAATQVRITAENGALCVELRNGPATGPPPTLPGSGHGLIGMRERARALGGELSAAPCADGGWRLAARLPMGTPQ